jgi:FtsP/CotA-like multicopper oxidase with cupredoxin domain
MTPTLAAPLAPFADALPVPQRLVAAEHHGELSVLIRAGVHRFHRDLPESAIWGYDGTVPGPTIEAERGQPVTVAWRNELDGVLPVAVTTAPKAADASGVPSASTHTRSPKSPSASPPTAAATCTTATSSNTKTAT